jgi:hemerythrin-like domain-containing protein
MADGAETTDEHADPTLQLLVNLTREGAVLTAFQATHDKFRGYHADLLRLAGSASSDDQALDELLRTLDTYADLFHEHHSAEDHYFFPALRRAEPTLDPVVDQLVNQHIELAVQLATVVEQADLIRSGTDTEDGFARLVAELMDLQARVEEHLQFEETSTVPVLRTWRSWPL